MNKTRMGKRVASLLLSLVMMLSLLPTAAYATMADDVDTQGASVSENGTGVSDDDNSGGDTGDQQVVGGSANGGTADDTTGAEGDADTTGAEGSADPTDSVNGNDSADPQDDGDAVMPVASNVVSTSEELVAAITAANDGDTITLGEGEFTTYGNTSPKKSLTFVGAGDKTVWIIGDLSKDVKSEGNGDCSFDGCETITFQNMTLKSDGADYRGFIRISNTVVKKCTLVGKTAYWGYETAKFEDSTFNAPVGDYALWDYSTKAMTLEGCTFNISGKGVNVYVEQPSTDARTVEVNSCTVNSTKADKAFLNIKNSTQAYDVTLSGTNTVTGLANDGTTGSALYQVETTKVTETTGNPVTVKEAQTDGTVKTVYEVKETVAETPMDLDAFIKAVVASGYNYDGNGVTVKWSPATGCYDTREGHTCTAGNVTATGNTPKRVNSGLTQFQLFEGQSNAVTVKNVNFVYEPAAFTVCENSGWKGSFTAEQAPAGQLYFMTSGDVNFESCTFEKVVLTSFNTAGTTTVKNCTFRDVYNSYAIKDVRGATVSVTGTTIENCGGGIMVSSTNKVTDLTITGNTFTNVDTATTAPADKAGTRALIQIANSGDYSAASYNLSNNTASSCGPVLRQLNTTAASGVAAQEAQLKSLTAEGGASGLYTSDTVKTYVAAVGEKKFETLQAAIDAAKSGATVTLLADTHENVTVSKNAIVLDLNGHTLNGGTENAKPALTVDNKKVTLKDSSEAQTGTIKREDTADTKTSHYVIDIQGKNGFMIVESGKVENNSGIPGVKGSSLIRLGNDSVSGWPTLTIKGGTFTQDNFIAIKVDRGTLHLLGGTVNSANSFAIENWNNAYIKGGTVNGTVSTWVYSTGAAFSKLEISGGTVNGNVASVNYDNAADKQARVYVTGGTVTGTLGTYTYNNGLVAMDETAKATIEVTGGTFSKDPTKYVVEDSAITPNGDGTYGVAKTYLAKIGDTEYYTMDEAFHAVKAGETIVMLRDYTTNKVQNSGDESFTIDLGGHTWTANIVDTASAAFEINYSDVTLTVKNGKVVSSQLAGLIPSAMSGTITYDNSGLVFENVEMTANGHSGIETNGSNTNDTVTLRNSTLNVPNGFGIYFPSSGTLTIENSKINAKTMGVQVCSGSLNVTGDKTAITVTGDGVAKTENDGAIEDGAAISIVERTGYKGLSEIEVSGGTFTAKAGNDAVKAYKWENQAASGFTQAEKVAVSGGTFSSAVDKSLCADGFIPTENTDGTYGVKEGKYVAEIGSQGYESLQAAIDAAQDGQTVTLLADATEDVVISKSITLDLGGKTLTNTNGGKATISVTSGTVTVKNGNVVGGTDYYNIEVTKGSNANLTLTDVTATAGNNGSSMIDNYGTLTITSGDYSGGLNVVKSEEGSKLTITGGTFTLNYATNGYTGVILVYGDTTISGGEFVQSLTTTGRWNHPQVIATGVVEGYTAITRVTGGHFVNKMSGESIFRGIGKATSDNFEVSGGTFNKSISDGYFKEGYFAKKTNNGYEADGPYAVRIGTTAGYATLGAAIEAINSGATTSTTITLLQDLTESVVISKNTTIDLNGKTLINNGAANTIQVNGGKLTVKDSSAKKLAVDSNTKTVTYTSGKIVNNQPRSAQCVAVKVNAGASFVLTSGTLESQHNYALNVTGENANATVNGGYIVGPEGAIGVFDKAQLTVKNGVMLGTDNAAIAGNGNAGNGDTTITISGGTIIGRIESAGYIACGIYHPQSGTLKISGGTIYAVNGVGILMRAGVLNMTGGKIVSSGNVSGRVGDANVITTCYGVYVDGSANYSGAKDAEFGAKISGTASITADAGVSVLNLSNSNATNGTIGVSGGTFSTAVPAAYCADGFIPTQNEDGTYGVKEGKFVAEVGSTKYETLAEAVAAAQDGQTVRLLADVADCGSLTISKNITLDGSGHTISGNSSISVNMPGNAAADVTIRNVNFKDIANGNKLSAFYFSQVKGKLTITGCTFDSIEYEAIQVTPMEGAEVNISNNVFKAKADGTQVRHIHIEMAYGSGFDCEGQNIKLTVTDNQLHGTVSGDASMGIWWVGTGSTLKVDGNYMEHPETVSITLANSGVHYNRGDLIYPARSQADVDVDDLMPAVIVADKASGESKINAYSTLAEAVAAAQDGQTVRLLADVEQNTQLTINKSITLDLNGKTIKNTVDIWGDNTNAILSITNGAKVTITGKGTIDAKENDCYTINVVKGDLTIENGTFYGNVSVVQVQEGTLSVKGGTFDLHQKWEGGNKYLFNCIDSEFTSGNAKVAISGGTFVDFDPNVSPEQKVDGKTPSFAAPGVGITKNENGSFTAAAGMTAQILDKDGNSVNAYKTLAEAVAAAQDGQTVRLLANVAESSIKVNANITIDLNKMTVTGSFVTYGEVTIQNGTIDVPDSKTNFAYGKLTLADVDITGKAASSSLLSVNYNGSVTIDKDSTIVVDSEEQTYPAVFIKGQDDGGKTYAPELNIYGTVQSGKKMPAIQGNGTDRGVSHINVYDGAVVKSEKLAMYLPQPCEVNISGGLVEGYCGIGIKSGTLNITGGTVRGVANDNVIGDKYSQTNGISYDGSAIMIDSYIGYAGQVQINISGNAVVESKYSTAIREIGNDKSQTNLVGLDITGGTVLGAKDTDAVLVRDVTAKDVNISGGEFSSIVKKEYCAPGFTPVTTANSEGRYGVEIGKFTVKVTSRTTGSDSPVANVAGGGSDITYAEGITVTASAISGYNFVGWFVNEYTGTPYSTDLTCEVKPTDDWTMIAVYEPISGGKFWLTVTASEFTVNGGAVQDSYLYEQFAVGASVTVNFTGSENFLYWVNASNKVVSTEKSYSFIMGSETTLKAVYGKARQNQATVVFISHSDQIISSKAYTTSDTIQFPVPPIKMGCTFTGWSMTEAEIRAAMAQSNGIIEVRALYTEPSIACKVTVVYPEGTDNQVVNAVVGKAIDVTAKDIEGKTFSYWTDDKGTVLGYTKTLKLAPSGDMTVKAVYDQATEAKPVITMSEVSATTANESYVVTFMATRAVPNGYKVVKQGILWSRDAVCGEDGAAAYMQFDSNGKLPDGVRAYIGNNLELNGVTRYDITTKYNDRTFYGRGYMVLESDAGEILYIYTDTIASGSYDSLTK